MKLKLPGKDSSFLGKLVSHLLRIETAIICLASVSFISAPAVAGSAQTSTNAGCNYGNSGIGPNQSPHAWSATGIGWQNMAYWDTAAVWTGLWKNTPNTDHWGLIISSYNSRWGILPPSGSIDTVTSYNQGGYWIGTGNARAGSSGWMHSESPNAFNCDI